MSRAGRILQRLAPVPDALFVWVPVLIALGIGGYFLWPGEPGRPAYAGAAALMLAGLGLMRRRSGRWRPAGVTALCLGLGFVAAGYRAHSVAAPVLGFRYYGPVEGRVVAVDRSFSDQIRATLDRVVLERVAPERTPARVRVALHGGGEPELGSTMIVTAHLSPPEGPVEPGGFDFQRLAWFEGLGAVGYSRSPALRLAPPEPRALPIARLRAAISVAVQKAIGGEAGGFAAAVLTGDRSGIGRATVEALRGSNLSHLLAISGLHMGLLTGFVFAALRYGLALIPAVALRLPVRKVAAAVSLVAAAFYLALSGGNVATERAFVMVSVMLVAVLADRRALSLRSVAIAAILILLAQPESLPEPGFQMSFAATTVLVAGFGMLRDSGVMGRVPGWSKPVLALVLSSALAGFATAPIAAAHFNRIAEYGLLANLLSVPVMGLVVMPMAVIAALLAPVGLAWLPLVLMGWGVRWILWVADFVAGLDGAVAAVPAPPGWVLPALSLGALWLMFWRGPVRGLGGLALAVALTGWAATPRPELLIAGDGKLAGLLGGPDGLRGLSKAKGAGFVAQSWLENDGDMVEQAEAAERAGFSGTKARRAFRVAGRPAVLLSGKTAEASFAEACAAAALVVIDAPRPAQSGPCLVIDAALLEKTGPLAIRAGENGLDLTATRALKPRLWSGTHRDSADWQHARWAWPEAAVRRAGPQAPR